jgi:adenylyltransferase/sulfurtransferase
VTVRINLSPLLSKYSDDQQEVEVDGSTVGQCLDHLVKRFPDIKQRLFNSQGELHNHIDVYVNGKSAYPEELTHPVKSGDELYILFILAGG